VGRITRATYGTGAEAPRPAAREGRLVPWEDGVAFLADTPHLDAEEASERLWPLDVA
jgi:hypothetical protein